MAKIAFEWADTWAYFPSALPETKEDILKALKSMLESSSPNAQAKALEAAPMPIIKAHLHLLHPRAKKALGLEDERKVKKWSYEVFS